MYVNMVTIFLCRLDADPQGNNEKLCQETSLMKMANLFI